MTKMIKQLAHICIHTYDLKKTEDFYCSVLGLNKKFEFQRNGKLFGFYLELGNNNYLEFFHNPEVENTPSQMRHFCLEVENIDFAIETLKKGGIEVTEKKLGSDKSWQCWIEDPNGIPIELQEYTAESSQYTGENRIADW